MTKQKVMQMSRLEYNERVGMNLQLSTREKIPYVQVTSEKMNLWHA